jgi:RHS repeat-associated protein
VTEDPSGQPQNDLQRKAYGYTAAGDVHATTDELRGIAYTYTYDSLHRMLTETNNGGLDPVTYQYNAIGNITSRQVGSNTFTYTYDTAKKHAVKTINLNGNNYTFDYDANGNMIAGYDFTDPANVGTRAITYNADNLPSQIQYTNGSTVTSTYLYDGDGARWKKAVQGGSTTYYIGSHYEVSGGVATLYIFAGNTRIVKIAGSNKHYFHKDHLGSSTKTSDGNGVGVETTEYMPFGPMREHSGTVMSNYKYTDQELDPETGLYFYGARYYDPIIGRFISADTIVQNFSDPQTLNRYSYCINNPLVYRDPSGHFFWVIAGAVIGAVIAGSQSDWNPKAMAVGAVIGGVSAGVGSIVGGHVGGAFGSELAAAVAGGAAAGAYSGGLYTAYYGGNIGEGMLKGAAYGAGASLAMYGAAWGAGQVYGWAKAELSVHTAQSGERIAKANFDLNVSEDPILSDPRLEPEFERAWIKTRGETPEAREQGGFVIDDPAHPVLRLPSGTAHRMDFPTSHPANARAWFHTHPFWRDYLIGDVLWEYPFEPSSTDLEVNRGWNIPGYIFDRRGVIKMDPGSKQWGRWTNTLS